MKINIIIPFNLLTGGIRVIFLYANFLQNKGYDVICYIPIKAYSFNRNKLRILKSTVANLIRGSKVSWFENKFKIKLVPLIKDNYIRNADIVIATTWPTSYDVHQLGDKKGKKFYFVQGYEIWCGDLEEVKNSYKLPLDKIVISKELNNILKYELNEDSKIIYNGIEKKEFIKESKIVNSKKIILMQYNSDYIKAGKEGIEVLKKVKKKYDINVILFGFKKDYKVPSEFTFYENPDRKTLMELYSRADIYLLPSREESWGLPVIEAMANKCCVVGTNVGCIKELCNDKKNALIAYDLDYDQLYSKLELAICDDELLIKIQKNGYELAKQFSWEKSYLEFEKYITKKG